jgi:hypothetical protein
MTSNNRGIDSRAVEYVRNELKSQALFTIKKTYTWHPTCRILRLMVCNLAVAQI